MELFERLLPVVDGIALSCRWACLLGGAAAAWIAVWLFRFTDVNPWLAGGVALLVALPVLVLLRIWWGVEELRQLPGTVATLVSDTRGSINARVSAIRAGEGGATRKLSGAVGELRQLGSLADEARDLLGAYVSIGTLVNPWSILFGIAALLCVPGLVFIAAILVVLVLI